MKFKLFTAALALITLSSFACEPKLEDQKPTSLKKQILQIKSAWSIKRFLSNQGHVWLHNSDFAERIGGKKMTLEELDAIIYEETSKDPRTNDDLIRNNLSLIIRTCPEYLPLLPLFSNDATSK